MLRDVIPKEAQERIEHVKLASEMFVILNKIYGDPATSVRIIVNKLLQLKLGKTTDYDKMLELCDIVKLKCVVLSSLSTEATDHVKYNTSLFSNLIKLLPGDYLGKWYDHSAGSSSNKWDMFTMWLEQMEDRANATKARQHWFDGDSPSLCQV